MERMPPASASGRLRFFLCSCSSSCPSERHQPPLCSSSCPSKWHQPPLIHGTSPPLRLSLAQVRHSAHLLSAGSRHGAHPLPQSTMSCSWHKGLCGVPPVAISTPPRLRGRNLHPSSPPQPAHPHRTHPPYLPCIARHHVHHHGSCHHVQARLCRLGFLPARGPVLGS
jgi:hypothetical protein